jgi:hypothetical protein
VRPNEYYITADGKSTGAVTDGTLVGCDSDTTNHKLASITTGGSTLQIRDSVLGDGERVFTINDVTGSTARYVFFCHPTSTFPGAAVPLPSSDIGYMAVKYRQNKGGAFTADNQGSFLTISWNDVNNSATTDSPCHLKWNETSLAATQYSDNAEGQIHIPGHSASFGSGTISGLTADPANATWRTVEIIIIKSRGLVCFKDWNGTVRAYSLRGALDWDTRYPCFEWFVSNLATQIKYEVKAMWAAKATSIAANAAWKLYVDNILASVGEAGYGAPTEITTSNLDQFTGTTTNTSGVAAVKGAAGQDWISPWYTAVSGNAQYMHIDNNTLAAGWYNWFDNAAVRSDKVFASNNQRVRGKMAANGFIMILPVRLGTDGCVLAQIQNSNPIVIHSSTGFTETRTQRANTGSNQTISAGDDYEFTAIGRFFISTKAGVYVNHWLDTADVWTAKQDASHRLMGAAAYATGAGANIDEVEHYDLGASAWIPSKMTKSGTQTFATSGTWVQITSWVGVFTASGGVPTNIGIVVSNGLLAIGTPSGTKTINASVPFTGNTGGRANQIRIKKNGTVIATGSTVSTSSGTCTATASGQTITSEDSITVEMASTGASSGTITASTPYVEIV